ncbi:hypothetical protein MA05_01920 [Comamonas aquatica]|nr:hypothetical protein MA05_01920 [Comamonas aquatica]
MLRAKPVTQYGLYLFTQVFAFIQLNYLKVSIAQAERGDSSPKLFGRREINSNEQEGISEAVTLALQPGVGQFEQREFLLFPGCAVDVMH